MEQVLSVFCDESGDFGKTTNHAPLYLVALVLHDQSHSMYDAERSLERSLRNEGLSPYRANPYRPARKTRTSLPES